MLSTAYFISLIRNINCIRLNFLIDFVTLLLITECYNSKRFSVYTVKLDLTFLWWPKSSLKPSLTVVQKVWTNTYTYIKARKRISNIYLLQTKGLENQLADTKQTSHVTSLLVQEGKCSENDFLCRFRLVAKF